MDQPDGFSGNDSRDIEIAGRFRCRIFGGDRVYILQQLKLAGGGSLTSP